MSTLSAGTTLQHGKYRIISTLGQGGFGITYLAENTMLEGKVAIKEFFYKEYCDRDADTRHVTVPTSGNRDVVDRFKQKFVKEARTIFKLPHPNIVRILDVFEENGTAYYVMDYIEGESLSEMVARRGYIPEAEALAYICDVAQALTYIHSKKVNHLDVKPGNMIRRRNDGKVLLIDFGVAKQYDAASLKGTTTTPVCISAGYSPAEQYRKNGVQSFSPQSDVYALAATLYKLLTGVTPPEAMDVQDEGLPVDELMAKQVSQHVRLAIALAMKGKSERTQSVELFIRHLTESSNEETVNLHDQEPKKPQPKPKKPQQKSAPKINQFDKAKKSKSLYIWGIGGAVALALLIGIIKFCSRSSGGDASPETSVSTAMVDTVHNVVNQTFTVNGVSFDMVEVVGGTFTMGATAEQGSDAGKAEKPAHQVTLSSYMIGKTEVTQELWEAVMGKSLSQIASELGISTYGEGANYPMYYVSWEDCQEFITKLNALTGKNFRLPTEAEWEFAARGGDKSRGYKYSGSNTVDDVAWYDDSTTHPVATKASNELGIYDMSGNVWEWCNDGYGSYTSASQTNPTGPDSGWLNRVFSGFDPVFRGGSWCLYAECCRVSYRRSGAPLFREDYFGLRLAL